MYYEINPSKNINLSCLKINLLYALNIFIFFNNSNNNRELI